MIENNKLRILLAALLLLAATVSPAMAAIEAPTSGTGINDVTIVGYGTDKDTYNRGDRATCYVDIQNTGDVVINKVDFTVSCYRYVWFIKIKAFDELTYSLDQQNIQPGTTKRVEITMEIPAEYEGISTAGSYQFEIVVNIGGENIYTIRNDIEVI